MTAAPPITRSRLGLVGVGWIGSARSATLEESGLVEVAGVADPAVEGALDALEELLERDLDGVVIATPSALHAEQALAALERGLGVFCQKPLGRTAGETRRVVDAARASDRLLGVDLSYRHVEGFVRARELVRSGSLGTVFAADLAFHNAYGPDKPWYYDPALSGGGCVIDLGTHLVDLALWTLGFPEIESVSSRLYAHGRPLAAGEVEDYAVAELGLAGGATARLACSWRLHAGVDAAIEATFYGTDGAVRVRNVGGSFYDLRADLLRGTTSEELAPVSADWGGGAALAWARRLADGGRYDPEVERIVDVAVALDRIYGR